ncbi:hypothetical protein Fmac_015873 [Flemingia macrophylla]|uniref:F-box domain-containing protein n=1 Tax=Flemingia macrophylla TaxID=520843 RepID=A0ABD1MFT2_9FABA
MRTRGQHAMRTRESSSHSKHHPGLGGAMEELNSDEWLPLGWTVEVRMRRNGRRDKAMVEKAIAEWLTPEWVKMARITTNGDTIGSVPHVGSSDSNPKSTFKKDEQSVTVAAPQRKISIKEGKEGKSIMKKKDEEKSDRLSDLPDTVLLYIMELMETKNAVQTCVLSKRWEHLWKRLSKFIVNTSHFNSDDSYREFLSNFLFGRDNSFSMLNFDFRGRGSSAPGLLCRLMSYASLYNIQEFSVSIDLLESDLPFLIFLFLCPSLTSLKLSMAITSYDSSTLRALQSVRVPTLKTLELCGITFPASDSGIDYAEPFSRCTSLNTLILDSCYLHYDAKYLWICNSNLSKLTIIGSNTPPYPIALSTPNLRSFTVMGINNHIFCSPCNLSFIEEVTLDTDHCIPLYGYKDLYIMKLLPVFNNVKTMTLSLSTLHTLTKDLSNAASESVQPPCYDKLKSLKVTKSFGGSDMTAKKVRIALEYLLQKSTLAKIDVIY